MRIVSLGLLQTSLWLGITAAVLEAVRFVCTILYYLAMSLFPKITHAGMGINEVQQVLELFFNFHYLAGAIVGMTATFVGSFIVVFVFNSLARYTGGIPVGLEHPLDVHN